MRLTCNTTAHHGVHTHILLMVTRTATHRGTSQHHEPQTPRHRLPLPNTPLFRENHVLHAPKSLLLLHGHIARHDGLVARRNSQRLLQYRRGGPHQGQGGGGRVAHRNTHRLHPRTGGSGHRLPHRVQHVGVDAGVQLQQGEGRVGQGCGGDGGQDALEDGYQGTQGLERQGVGGQRVPAHGTGDHLAGDSMKAVPTQDPEKVQLLKQKQRAQRRVMQVAAQPVRSAQGTRGLRRTHSA